MANSTTTIDWETLREEGLQHLQAMSGHLWTDYNIHDPGVTLLELLCYAITDLNERLSLDIADLVTENTATTTTEHFFSPGSILTVNPVTINDYRKLLIDLPGVKNAWIELITGSEPALYFDQDNNALLYDYASGAQKVSLNGLYRVYIECEENVTDNVALKETVLQKLHDHRNLGEDFVEVNILGNETISVFSDIQIDENADRHEVMAQIYFDLKNFISPRVKQYSLKRMLQKGKSIEELFTGPPLENGFIDDDELGNGKKVKELHTSDLIRIIMANEAVKDVRNLFITNSPKPGIRDKQEWALVVDDTKALVLESFSASKLRLFRNETLCPITPSTVLEKVALLEAAAAREIYDDPAMDLSESLPEIPDELSDYETNAYQLPANYGVGETGLPSNITEARRSQVRQLRVYLTFFEQILVNYLKQLNSFKQLFAFRQDRSLLLKSYFSRLVPEELWQGDYLDYLQVVLTPPTSDKFNAIIESVVLNVVISAANKRERVGIDSFTIIAGANVESSAKIWNYLKAHDYIDADGNVLPAFDPKADDFVFHLNWEDKDLKAIQTRFAAEIGKILANYYSSNSCVPENAFTGIGGVNEDLSKAIWQFLYNANYLNSDGKVFVVDPTENLPLCATAFSRKNRILDHLLAQFNERFADYALFDYKKQPFIATKSTNKDEYYLKSKADFLEGYPELSRNRNRAYNYWLEATASQPTDGLKNLIASKLGITIATDSDSSDSEEFYIVEHILFRPRETVRLDFICSEKIAADYQPDPYSYQVTFVIPKRAGRFSNSKFKELAYTTIANETPAHIIYNILEFNTAEMSAFTECYRNYLQELTKWQQGTSTQYNLYRKQLMELIGIGELKLPVLHLDATDVAGDSTTPAHGTTITKWTDLSGNSHHALNQMTVLQWIQEEFTREINSILAGDYSSGTFVPKNAFAGIGGVDEDLSQAIWQYLYDADYINRDGKVLTAKFKPKTNDGFRAIIESVVVKVVIDTVYIPIQPLAVDSFTVIAGVDATVSGIIWNHFKNKGYIDADGNVLPAFAPEAEDFALELDSITIVGLAYYKPASATLPWIRSAKYSRLQIANSLFKDDFSIAVVFRTELQTGREETAFSLAAGEDSTNDSFNMGFSGNGDVYAGVGTETVYLESEPVSPHLAIFSYDSTAAEFSLTLDGVLKLTQTVSDITLAHETVTIGHGAPCDLGEVIVLDSVLTGSKKTKLEEYLAEKWSIPLSAVSSIAQPVLHLDASVATSITKTDLTHKVSQWKDVSLNKSAVTQGTTKLQPVYYLDGIGEVPALYFSDNVLTLLNPDQKYFKVDFTLALVYQADSGGGYLLDGLATDDQNGFAIGIGTKGALTLEGETASEKLPATLGTAHIAIVTGRINDDQKMEISVWLDGRASLTTMKFSDPEIFSNCPKDFVIGRSRSGKSGFIGKIGEIVIFDEALSVWDRQRLENFLSDKWQIDISGVESVTASVLHLDASRQASVLDETKAVLGRGTPVYQWLDLSSGDNDAIQSNTSRRPQYLLEGIKGLGAIKFTQKQTDTFDYYDDSLNVDRIIQKDFTIMLVFQPDNAYYAEQNIPAKLSRNTAWTEGVGLLDADCSGKYNDFGLSFAKIGTKIMVMGGIGDRMTADHTIHSGELDFTIPHFITFTREQASGLVKLYVDGLFHAQADLRDKVTLNDPKAIKIGAFNSGEGLAFHGLIGEVIIFDQVLTDQKRQQIDEYLSNKWQISLVTLPLDTTGLSLHFDASTTSCITQDSERRVSQWTDTDTMKEVAAVQAVPEYQPTYLVKGSSGTPAIRFNNNFMKVAPKLTSSDDLTLGLVYTALSTGNMKKDSDEAGIVDHYSEGKSNDFVVAFTRNSTLRTRTGEQLTDAACTLNTPHIGIVTRSQADGTAKIYLDGLLAASGDGAPDISLNELDEWYLGAFRQLPDETVSKGYFHGELAEVILFNRVLTKAERQSFEGYCASKWKLDLSGIKSIATPVLHLDASILATIIESDTGKVAQWLDRNGHSNCAVQIDSAKQPEYQPNVYQELGAVHFEQTQQSCLTLEPMVSDDFAIFIVYRAEQKKPVAIGSFTVIAGVDAEFSATIWNYFKEQGYIDVDGNVLSAFSPGADDFVLDLDLESIQTQFTAEINNILTEYYSLGTLVSKNAFISIGGVNGDLSQDIWEYLYDANYLNSDGKVINVNFAPQANDRFSVIIKSVVVNVVLNTAYTPVALDSFSVIAGVDAILSATIWNHFKNKGYIDADGNVLPAFTPGKDDFALGLDSAVLKLIQDEFITEINTILAKHESSGVLISENAFTGIGGVNEDLSRAIWQHLYGANYLSSDGKVITAKFEPKTNDGFSAIIESVVLNVVLAQNWLEGAGLFDGNYAGERSQLNKRDFGLLVGKGGQLLAGIGVADDQDYQLAQTTAFGQWHLGVLTRVKDTGVTRLYLDGATPVEKKLAKGISLKDVNQITIGAENNGGNYFTGDIGEIIVLDTVPDDTQIATIQSYLAKKWGTKF